MAKAETIVSFACLFCFVLLFIFPVHRPSSLCPEGWVDGPGFHHLTDVSKIVSIWWPCCPKTITYLAEHENFNWYHTVSMWTSYPWPLNIFAPVSGRKIVKKENRGGLSAIAYESLVSHKRRNEIQIKVTRPSTKMVTKCPNWRD